METRKKKSFKRLFAFLMAFVMVSTLAVSAVFAAPTFKDVPETAWYYGYVENLAAKEIVTGYGESGEFRPDNKVSREEAAKMIAKAAELPFEGKKADFPDVDKDGWASPYIAALVEVEAIKGYPDGFRPKEDVKRGHAAKMVAIAFGLEDGEMKVKLTDLPKDDVQVADAIVTLASNGVVKGYGSSALFKPDETISRAEFSKVLYMAMVAKAVQVAEEEETEDAGAAAQKLIDGIPAGQDKDAREYLQDRLTALYLSIDAVVATTDSIRAEADQQLEFTVNGRETEATDLVGYEVVFEYNKVESEYTTNGLIDGTDLNVDDFEYRVVIKKDSVLVKASAWKKVDVIDATKVTKVNKVGLSANPSADPIVEWDQAVLDGKVKLFALEYENALGEKNTDEKDPLKATAPEVLSASSSDALTAYYDGSVIKVLKDGKVTFTVKFADVKDAVKITVSVVKTQVMKSIDVETKKVKAAVEDGIEFTVLDQNGDTYLTASSTVYMSLKKVPADATTPGPFTINLVDGVAKQNVTLDKKGLYTFEVKTDAGATGVKLGEFSVEAVDVSGNPDKYEISLEDEDAKAEINIEAGKTKAVELLAKATIQGVNVGLPNETGYKVIAKSSNEEIAVAGDITYATGKFEVTLAAGDKAKAGDKVDIQLYIKEASKETAVGNKVTITIVDTTFQVTSLTLKKNAKVDSDASDLKDAVIAVVRESVGDEGKVVTADMIDNVTFVESNMQVIVNINAANGGKTFVLDAKKAV